MENGSYEEADHTADWALIARGRNLDDLFESAARGMTSLMGVQPGTGPKRDRQIQIEASDAESLLVAWLEELLFGVEARGVAYTHFDVHCLDRQRLEARVEEVPASAIERLIKAVTFHGLRIEETQQGLQARVVFDV